MLRGEKVGLVALRYTDLDQLLPWINDPETVRYNAPFSPVHEPAHKNWFERISQDAARVVFGIRTLDDAALIGVVQLVDIHPVHRCAELVIRIGTEVDRGRGVGSEAVRLATRFAFRDRNLQRVFLRVFTDNRRAVRAYEKAGFEVEGHLKRAAFIDGSWRDEFVMACLSDERS